MSPDRARPPLSPTLSIVIGTLNRCASLPKALESLLAQTCDSERLEIIVVDNGSTDGTAQVVKSFTDRTPRVRYALEPKLGLSNARNKGIAESRGDYVAFFDDDATAEPQWAGAILSVIDAEPGVGAVGGPIVVEWPGGARPDWIPSSREGYYGHCNYGPERRELKFPQYPFGSNMIIRRERLHQINGFRDSVGPKGKNMMSAGEQDLFLRLSQHSPKIIYEPTAVVHHWITHEQVTKKWLLRRALKHGMSNTLMLQASHQRRDAFWLNNLLLACTRVVVSAASASLGAATRRHPSIVMSRSANMMYWNGVARGSLTHLLGR